MIIVKINENGQLYTFLVISLPAFSSSSLHLHLHSPSLPNYNISHSFLPQNPSLMPFLTQPHISSPTSCSPFPFFSVHFSHARDLPNCERVKNWHNRLHTWHQRDSARWNTTDFLSNNLFFNPIRLPRTFCTRCRWNFMFSQEIVNLQRKYCEWWQPLPLFWEEHGDIPRIFGSIGLGCVGLDCHRMTAIYSLLLFPLFKCQYPCERGILSTPLDQQNHWGMQNNQQSFSFPSGKCRRPPSYAKCHMIWPSKYVFNKLFWTPLQQ